MRVRHRNQEYYDEELQSTLNQIQMERSASSRSLASMDDGNGNGSRSSSLRSLGSIGNLGSLGELPSPELVRISITEQYSTVAQRRSFGTAQYAHAPGASCRSFLGGMSH